MRILLVEDDPMIGKSVQIYLKQEGHAVDWVRDGIAAELALGNGIYELLLLDLTLPRKSGHDILLDLRAKKSAIPVLIITARDSVADKIKEFDCGADDFLVKPFDLDELNVRIRAVTRRYAGRADAVIEHGPIRLNPATHGVELQGRPIKLAPREFSLLSVLLERPGIPLSRQRLEESIFGWGEEPESCALDVHIHNLRGKLGQGLIVNIRGVGWMIPKNL